MVTLILTTIGPAADYGSFGRWPLLVTTLIYWGSLFSTMTLTCKSQHLTFRIPRMLNTYETAPSRWGVAMGLFIIDFICFGLTLAFYAAIFPRLARNTPRMHELRDRLDRGEITVDKYNQAEALEKSKISSFSIVRTLLSLPPRVVTWYFRLLNLLASSQFCPSAWLSLFLSETTQKSTTMLL